MTVISEKMMQKINRGLMSRYPLFYVLGWDEERIEHLLSASAASHHGSGSELVVWTPTKGFGKGPSDGEALTDPVKALDHIAGTDRPAMYLMKDLPALFKDNSALVRAVRDLYYQLRNRDTFVFFSHPELALPEVLKKELFLVEMDLPSEEEIVDDLASLMRSAETPPPPIAADQLHKLAGAMKGLSLNEVEHLQARLFRGEEIDVEHALAEIQEEKSQLLRKESVLKFYPPQRSLDAIGGLDNLKEWMIKRKDLFSDKAYRAGIPLPAGLLLMGISGCGKSMAAKAVAAAWDLPLVRLDMSLVLSGSFGPPEYAFEHATKIANEISPIVLWIDEIENSLGLDETAGKGGNANIFSSLLTWLQEKSPKVFVAATANRIQALPAELIRKGRFDQLFFLDLPTAKERMEIFKIHIALNGGDPEEFNLAYLAAATNEWSGAEIEQAVKSGRIDAYQQERPFTQKDITHNAARMVPLSRTMTEQIKAIKKWSFDRAVPASPPAET